MMTITATIDLAASRSEVFRETDVDGIMSRLASAELAAQSAEEGQDDEAPR